MEVIYYSMGLRDLVRKGGKDSIIYYNTISYHFIFLYASLLLEYHLRCDHEDIVTLNNTKIQK